MNLHYAGIQIDFSLEIATIFCLIEENSLKSKIVLLFSLFSFFFSLDQFYFFFHAKKKSLGRTRHVYIPFDKSDFIFSIELPKKKLQTFQSEDRKFDKNGNSLKVLVTL